MSRALAPREMAQLPVFTKWGFAPGEGGRGRGQEGSGVEDTGAGAAEAGWRSEVG